MKQKKSLKKVGMKLPKHLQHINVHAAGIDIGSRSHFVAVPEGADEKPVREFSGFTGDLEHLRNDGSRHFLKAAFHDPETANIGTFIGEFR